MSILHFADCNVHGEGGLMDGACNNKCVHNQPFKSCWTALAQPLPLGIGSRSYL